MAIIMKMLNNYMAIVSAIATFQIDLPSAIGDTAKNIGNPISQVMFSLDCFLVEMSSIEILYFRVIWGMLIPCIYLLVFFFGYMILVVLKRAEY